MRCLGLGSYRVMIHMCDCKAEVGPRGKNRTHPYLTDVRRKKEG